MTFDDKSYNILKWICLICLPAIGVLYMAVSSIWGLPYAMQVSGTLDAIGVFIGSLIGLSTKNYNKKMGE